MKKLILFTFILITALEITSHVGIQPIEIYDAPMRDGYDGFAFYPIIMYKRSHDIVKYNLNGKSTRIHELKHHAQAEEHGFLSYKLQYAYQQLTVGYNNNHFEIEAYAAERVRPIKRRDMK